MKTTSRTITSIPAALTLLLALASLLAPSAMAQESPSFRLSEATINAGGNPDAGQQPSSASFRISLDAIGEAVGPTRMSGASFTIEGGFVSAYPPPDEVLGLVFDDAETLRWNASFAAGVYHLYRDDLAALSGAGFGQCAQQALASTRATDAERPAPSEGFFYLVTVENRLGEEGIKGFGSAGDERGGTTCP